MSEGKPRIAITGAEGLVGGLVRAGLTDAYEIHALTRAFAPFPSQVVDLADVEGLTEGFRGSRAVIHLAAASRVDSAWPEVLESNIVGVYHVFEAARRARVSRIVFASSNHVVGMYERDQGPNLESGEAGRPLRVTAPLRPDSLYGVSKGYGELLGRYYSDRFGMRVICLRLGSVLPDDDPSGPAPEGLPASQAARWPARVRATWLSHRDCVQLIRCALEANTHFAIVFGTSANEQPMWSLDEAKLVLGYRPVDRASLRARGSP